jgi:hypothetical protein
MKTTDKPIFLSIGLFADTGSSTSNEKNVSDPGKLCARCEKVSRQGRNESATRHAWKKSFQVGTEGFAEFSAPVLRLSGSVRIGLDIIASHDLLKRLTFQTTKLCRSGDITIAYFQIMPDILEIKLF